MKINLAPRKTRRNITPKAMLSAVAVAAGLMASAGPAGAVTATVNTDSGASSSFQSGTTSSSCSTSGTRDPHSCATAVSWAKSHETKSYHSAYVNMCDHIVGLAYGFPASGSTTAYVHWTQIPSSFKHAGSSTVPAGGLAFFSGGAGHVMISIGGGKFVSNDINGRGTLTETTIASVKSKWGKPYLGWAQPWFKYNH